MPYVKEYDWTGKISVAWSDQIVPVQNIETIPSSKIAIEQELGNSLRRL